MEDKFLTDATNRDFLRDEESILSELLPLAVLSRGLSVRVNTHATQLVNKVRAFPERFSPLDRFLTEYDLASDEGVLLMCLAESLLRVPDADTADALIADKIKIADWERHMGNDDLLVNASTWGLMLTGHILPALDNSQKSNKQIWQKIIGRLGEPIIRNAISLAMRIIGDQFVMGSTIEKAIDRTKREGRSFESYSFDMLGEAALTNKESECFLSTYSHAIKAIGSQVSEQNLYSVSVKLSALCPRFEVSQWQRAYQDLLEKLSVLAFLSKNNNVQLTIDAEESDRLELTLAVFEAVFSDPKLGDWNGFGIAVQAYQKRAKAVMDYLASIAKLQDKLIPVRLVKGAYWDTEIKQAQVKGLVDYPVFTRKCNTDVSYLAAVKLLLSYKGSLYPQFATHNAYTVAYITQFFEPEECEFQRLHGMGEALYESLNDGLDVNYHCRVYAPVGNYDKLLPYLVRRLLENGANTSFVHRIADQAVPVGDIVADPVQQATKNAGNHRHPNIVLPKHLFGHSRLNSQGINFSDRQQLDCLLAEIKEFIGQSFNAEPVIDDQSYDGQIHTIMAPTDKTQLVGYVMYSDQLAINKAIENAAGAWVSWDSTKAEIRADILERVADLLQDNQGKLMALCIREAGKTVVDAQMEVREAIDFLRYYAMECRRLFGSDKQLPGPVGERDSLRLRARGIFICISPWNFPVAIYAGQVAAALAAGNSVLAKPAEQTSLTAMFVTELMYEAGIPRKVLSFIPGDGARIAKQALADPRITGVAFTGSYDVAKSIEMALAERSGPIATLMAETGGINAMLVDSTALPEQVVMDAVISAFNSAGQRCSACRVLYLQEDIANIVTELLIGRMQELCIGDPLQISTDIGPVIDKDALDRLQVYINSARKAGRLMYQLPVPSGLENGLFIGPAIIRIEHIDDIPGEVFGPVLHIVKFTANQLDDICTQVNDSGFGLTFSIHSRINHRIETISQKIRAGNVYVNRNMIGAVVGSQPFGGCGLSGTGPKAGGENYLTRFATEQTLSENTTAMGGNASLLSMDENSENNAGD